MEQRNFESFTGRAAAYAAGRPSYAPRLFKWLEKELGSLKGLSVADIGSGTGIFSRQLLQQGCQVFAVEPNHEMRAIAEQDLSRHYNFTSLKGSDAATGLANQSVSLVSAAQAFHWFNPAAFRQECQRILKPGGSVLLVWNWKVHSSLVQKTYNTVLRQYCPGYKGSSGGGISEDQIINFFSSNPQFKQFKNDLRYNLEQFLTAVASASYALKPDHPGYTAFINSLMEVFKQHQRKGILTIPNKTVAYLGKPY